MSNQNNTPPPLEGQHNFQMQAMMQMMERMIFVMGNVCDRLDRVERRGNEANTSTQDVRKLRAEPKANSVCRAYLYYLGLIVSRHHISPHKGSIRVYFSLESL
jgi:hypothetical protein